MKMLNTLEESADDQHAASVRREGLSILLRVLYPVIPHTAWTLWRDLGFDRDLGDVVDAPWPSVDAEALEQDEIELVLQVNGKMRGRMFVPFGTPEDELKKLALADPKVQPFTEGKQVVKVIVIPDKLVNIVVK